MSRILVVEDNPTNMKFASDILSQAGYEVIQAFDAPEGITKAETSSPHLILMDIHLPGMDGLEATHLLKQNNSTRHIPVLAVTACAMQGDDARALDAGCVGYISKPFRYKELLEVIHGLLRSDEAFSENRQQDASSQER